MTIAALGNRGGMSTTTAGTGDITLGAALGAVAPNVCSYIDFATSGIANNTLVSYLILDSNGAFECGRATFLTAGPQLTGRAVSKSSNSGGLINLTGSGVQVFITALVEDIGPAAILHVDAAQGLTSGQQAQARSNIFKGPTVQTLVSTAGSPYNTPANTLWLEVWIVGGGGGGSGAQSGTTASIGADGTKSTFNSIDAAPGKGGSASASAGAPSVGGAGGTGGAGVAIRRADGMPGGPGCNSPTVALSSGFGGGTQQTGGGPAGLQPSAANGNNAANNTGQGGGGAYNNAGSNNIGGGGGGGGEVAYLIINNPASTYNYAIGAGGAGGVNTSTGGNGGSGVIFVVEHYI